MPHQGLGSHVQAVACTHCRPSLGPPNTRPHRSVTPSALPSGPLSCVHRLVVDVDDGSQHRLVLKTAPVGTDDPARKLAVANKVFEREVGFYKCVGGGARLHHVREGRR